MNTDAACATLSEVAELVNEEGETPLKATCLFAILRMRELDSMKKILRGIVAEFKEAP